jgi:hypothetical protein
MRLLRYVLDATVRRGKTQPTNHVLLQSARHQPWPPHHIAQAYEALGDDDYAPDLGLVIQRLGEVAHEHGSQPSGKNRAGAD